MLPQNVSSQNNTQQQNGNPRKRKVCETIDVVCAACLDNDGTITKLKKSSISFHYNTPTYKHSHNEHLKLYPNTKYYAIDKNGEPMKKKQKTIEFFVKNIRNVITLQHQTSEMYYYCLN